MKNTSKSYITIVYQKCKKSFLTKYLLNTGRLLSQNMIALNVTAVISLSKNSNSINSKLTSIIRHPRKLSHVGFVLQRLLSSQ